MMQGLTEEDSNFNYDDDGNDAADAPSKIDISTSSCPTIPNYFYPIIKPPPSSSFRHHHHRHHHHHRRRAHSQPPTPTTPKINNNKRDTNTYHHRVGPFHNPNNINNYFNTMIHTDEEDGGGGGSAMHMQQRRTGTPEKEAIERWRQSHTNTHHPQQRPVINPFNDDDDDDDLENGELVEIDHGGDNNRKGNDDNNPKSFYNLSRDSERRRFLEMNSSTTTNTDAAASDSGTVRRSGNGGGGVGTGAAADNNNPLLEINNLAYFDDVSPENNTTNTNINSSNRDNGSGTSGSGHQLASMKELLEEERSRSNRDFFGKKKSIRSTISGSGIGVGGGGGNGERGSRLGPRGGSTRGGGGGGGSGGRGGFGRRMKCCRTRRMACRALVFTMALVALIVGLGVFYGTSSTSSNRMGSNSSDNAAYYDNVDSEEGGGEGDGGDTTGTTGGDVPLWPGLAPTSSLGGGKDALQTPTPQASSWGITFDDNDNNGTTMSNNSSLSFGGGMNNSDVSMGGNSDSTSLPSDPSNNFTSPLPGTLDGSAASGGLNATGMLAGSAMPTFSARPSAPTASPAPTSFADTLPTSTDSNFDGFGFDGLAPTTSGPGMSTGSAKPTFSARPSAPTASPAPTSFADTLPTSTDSSLGGLGTSTSVPGMPTSSLGPASSMSSPPGLMPAASMGPTNFADTLPTLTNSSLDGFGTSTSVPGMPTSSLGPATSMSSPPGLMPAASMGPTVSTAPSSFADTLPTLTNSSLDGFGTSTSVPGMPTSSLGPASSMSKPPGLVPAASMGPTVSTAPSSFADTLPTVTNSSLDGFGTSMPTSSLSPASSMSKPPGLMPAASIGPTSAFGSESPSSIIASMGPASSLTPPPTPSVSGNNSSLAPAMSGTISPSSLSSVASASVDEQSSPYTMLLSMNSKELELARSYGSSVSISGDGTVVAVGVKLAENKAGIATGAVYMYSMANPTGSELTLTQVVYGSEKADEEFGCALALSNDGKRLVVGARSENGQTGAIRIYEHNGGTWELMKEGLVAGKNPEVRAGWAVSISADGNVVAMGSPRGKEGDGTVMTFKHDGTVWKQFGDVVKGSSGGDEAGYSLSLSDTGSTMAIGCPKSRKSKGKVEVYVMNDTGNWVLSGQPLVGDAEDDMDGSSVAMSQDGSIVVIGGRGHNELNSTTNELKSSVGHCRIYQFSPEKWDVLYSIVGNDADERLGSSVAVSRDGNVVACGGVSGVIDGGASGVVRVWNRSTMKESTIWPREVFSGEATGSSFGQSVALTSDGANLVVGAPDWGDTGGGGGGFTGDIQIFRGSA